MARIIRMARMGEEFEQKVRHVVIQGFSLRSRAFFPRHQAVGGERLEFL